ncbi:hypothetical protein RB195_002495 [Necator americanus]|uniref:Uncharacterized protein n=1 Tax=Necator americanus TaxID=51031 RepID=A0ABR1DJB3_NECAM
MAWLLQVLTICALFIGIRSAGKCDLSAPPTSWLVTTGIGITKWATAGVATDGDNFCITVIKAALASGDPATVARTIERTTNLQDWAITVLQVDFTNPETHLNASSFADPNVWCSVYIGIDPSQGFSYLFEIQLGKVII